MSNAWSRIQPNSRTARILLAILFALPVISYLVLPWSPTYPDFQYEFGFATFFDIMFFVEFPIAGILVLAIVFGSIFFCDWDRKNLSIAWLACWVWFSFALFVAQYSAPLWYRPIDAWGYTFVVEQSLPVAGITAALFFLAAFFLARVAFETSGSITKRDAVITSRIIVIGCSGIIVVLTVVFISVRLDEGRIWRDQKVMKEMTPEKLIANCGQPTSDEQTDFLNLHTLFTRVLIYKRTYSWTRLEFKRKTNKPWHLTDFASPAITVSPSDDNSFLAIRQLPCMAK